MLVYGELLDGRNFVLENYYFDSASKGTIVGYDDHKSLAVDILRVEWRKAGCQPAGSGYPNSIRTGVSLSDVQREYRDLRAQAQNSESPQLQQEAIQKCMNAGVTIDTTKEKGDFCNERGIEYFLYDGEGDLAILIGHLYSMEGLLTDGPVFATRKAAKMKDLLNAAKVYPTISYKARTMISTSNPITMTPHPSWKNLNAYKIMVNKVPPMDGYTIMIPANRRTILEMEYNGLKTANWGTPKYTFIDMNLDMFQLFQSATKPFISFNFYNRDFLDANRVVELDSIAGLQFGVDAYKGIRPVGDVRVKINRRILSDLLRMITQRVKISGPRCTLFVLENTSSYTETCEVQEKTIVYTVRNGFDAPQIYTYDISGVELYNSWVNIAIEYTRKPETNEQSYTVYVNQKPMSAAKYSSKNFRITNETFVRPMDVYVMNPGFSGEMAWFHIYDVGNSGRVEGFQNPDGATGKVLDQEAEFDPQEQTGYKFRRKAAKIGDFLIDQVRESSLFNYKATDVELAPGPAPGPALAPTSDVVSATCPFEPVRADLTVNANYNPGVYYGQRFNETNITPQVKDNVQSAKECEVECTNNQGVAFTFNSATKKCMTYTDLGFNLTTEPDPNSISSVLKQKNDLGYDELKEQTLKAIREFKEIRAFLKSEKKGKKLYDKVFKERTGFGLYDRTMDLAPSLAPTSSTPSTSLSEFAGIVLIDDPRTETEINRDEKNVLSNMYSKDCLNGIYEKYRVK
jgi:hypothetical protein